MSDIETLAAAVAADPTDAVTIQALADAIEEAGAEAGCVRQLAAVAIDAPTLLVFGVPDHTPTETVLRARDVIARSIDWLENESGQPLDFVLVPSDWTLRVAKAQPARARGPS